MSDGAIWQFRFAKEYCNVARPAGTSRSQRPDLMRRWFGALAGQPGTAFQLRFHASPDGLWVEPVQADVIDLASRRTIVAYPDLRAAAGHIGRDEEPPDAELFTLPIDDANSDLFAVRVSGTSMDGGKQPLRDGDWAILRLARHMPASAVEGRVVLVEVEGDAHGAGYQIKRLKRVGRGWRLTSDLGQPRRPDLRGYRCHGPDRAPRTHGPPEELAPAIGTVSDGPDLAHHFGIEALPLPDVGYATWRAWGRGREASRRLFDGALDKAAALVELLLVRPEADRWIQRGDQLARIARTARGGGLRIDGGPGGFAERTVSLLDLAWVIQAAADVAITGGLLDEARVNKLRYLAGTPEGSTRWIDTGWAIAVWRTVSSAVVAP